ncbi:Polyketide synthase modules and related proteins [hydrothermal vent metagenome]|uniref:Polyketide synthase modules and related proteins n=1 Tax=hydrothermal vent metagenome TaxID=652676 RepID=A0A3B0YQW2_9ZZZZ
MSCIANALAFVLVSNIYSLELMCLKFKLLNSIVLRCGINNRDNKFLTEDIIASTDYDDLIHNNKILFLSEFAQKGGFLERNVFKKLQLGTLSKEDRESIAKKPYVIRLAELSDLDNLHHLESVCWAPGLQTEKKVLKKRLQQSPQTQFVVEYQGIVQGVLYTQAIKNSSSLDHCSSLNVEQLHHKNHRVLQLVSANVDPKIKLLAAGDQLLEYALQYSALAKGIDQVVAVTRCSAYNNNRSLEYNDYIHLMDDNKFLVDPTLRFHAEHGAKIVKPINNYRPNDIDNDAKGVLVQYDLESLFGHADNNESAESLAPQFSRDELRAIILRSADEIGKSLPAYSFQWDQAWLDLGFDSLGIMGLRRLLEKHTARIISSSLFFDYPSPQEMLNYLLDVETDTESFSSVEVTTGIKSPLEASQYSNRASTHSDNGCANIRDKRSTIDNDIAILGMSCRLPGANSIDEYWNLLIGEVDAINDIPESRWSLDRYFSEKIEKGKINHRGGGFLDEIDQFDASFFGITPREAAQMDPQQRIMLELLCEALESAQLPITTLPKTRTGIYIGQYANDYQLLLNNSDQFECDGYYATGNSSAVTAGRLAYFLGTQGPTLTIDTACSSSLVAVHQACQSLKQHTTDLMIVGGVNLILSPHLSIAFSQSGMLAADSHCKTFDDSADGYVRSEGAAVIVLKRLSDALRDGNCIQGIIKGSAINQDGRTNGLTAPAGLSQQAVIKQALLDANVKAAQISYLEAHGTGTSLGDPVELNAAISVLKQNRPAENPLIVGSVKTNIGHTESAAGLAGLIKTVLCLNNKLVPANLHFKKLNSKIETSGINLQIPVKAIPWETTEETGRYAGVSSFGFSGTNSHVILTGWEESINVNEVNVVTRNILTLSADDPMSLQHKAIQLKNYIDLNPQQSIEAICHSLVAGRDHYGYRKAWFIKHKNDAMKYLDALLEKNDETAVDNKKVSFKNGTAFLCTGQGAQYVGMARCLYEHSDAFKAIALKCETIYQELFDESICEKIFTKEADLINQTQFTQPALYLIEAGLVHYWQTLGVKPDYVMGHSVGEYAAAYAAGVFSLEDGFKLISKRGQLIQSLPSNGSMLAVLAPLEFITQEIAQCNAAQIAIAAINGADNVVLSGLDQEVRRFQNIMENAGYVCKFLEVSHAFHSPLLNSILPEFRKFAHTITFNKPQLPFISNVTGLVEEDLFSDPEYWVQHIVNPVRYFEGIQTLNHLSCHAWLEIGPKPVLINMARRSVQGNHCYLSSLDQGSDWTAIQKSLLEFYSSGIDIHWDRVLDTPYSAIANSLPHHWNRQRYWFTQTDSNEDHSSSNHLSSLYLKSNSLLGVKAESPLEQVQYQSQISLKQYPFLLGHQVYKTTTLPATAFISILIELLESAHNSISIENCHFSKPLFLDPDNNYSLSTILDDKSIKLYSKSSVGEHWVNHVSATLLDDVKDSSTVTSQNSQDSAVITTLDDAIAQQSTEHISPSEHYCNMAALNIQYQNEFQNITNLHRKGDQALAEFSGSTELGAVLSRVSLMDGCLQTFYSLIDYDQDQRRTFVPVSFKKLTLIGDVSSLYSCRMQLCDYDDFSGTASVQLTILDRAGKLVMSIEDLTYKQVTETSFLSQSENRQKLFYKSQWIEKQNELVAAALYLGDSNVIGRTLNKDKTSFFSDQKLKREQFDELSLSYFRKTLLLLLEGRSNNQTFTLNELSKQHNITGHMLSLFEHIIGLMEAQGWLEKGQGYAWRLTERFMDNISDGPLAEVDDCIELTLIKRFGSQLSQILSHKIDPARLLFPADKFDETARFYRSGDSFIEHNQLLTRTIKELIATVPDNKVIKILEIGAGTGGVSHHILQAVQASNVEYTFSDISAYFTNQVSTQFEQYPFVEYAVLDIEKCPLSQGFNAHSFDLMIAANVIHATSNLNQSLENVKTLLAPGGKLLLLEGVQQTTWIDLIFGCMDGWWRFQDGRKYPLMPVDQWQTLLADNGYVMRDITQQPDLDLKPDLKPESKPEPQQLFKQAILIADVAVEQHNKDIIVLLAPESMTDSASNLISHLLPKLVPRFEQNGCELIVCASGTLTKKLIESLDKTRNIGAIIDLYTTETTTLPEHTASINTRLMSNLQIVLANTRARKAKYWVVTNSTPLEAENKIASTTLGSMVKSVSLEHPEFTIACLGLPFSTELDSAVNYCLESILFADQESQIRYCNNRRTVERLLVEVPEVSNDQAPMQGSYQLQISTLGKLDSLNWVRSEIKPLAAHEIRVDTYASGINFRDVLNLLGLYPGDAGPVGDEFAGKVCDIGAEVKNYSIGDNIMGVAAGTFRNSIVTTENLVVKTPESLSSSEAATIPIVFLTSYYSLLELAELKQGDRLLVHSAAGGIGQAVIQIAQAKGAIIFATASKHKHTYLKAQGIDYIFDSRSLNFHQAIKSIIGEKNLDVVVNSLTGDYISKSIELLKPGGCFVELGKRDVLSVAEARRCYSDIDYHLVDLLQLIRSQPDKVGNMLTQLQQSFCNKQLKPIVHKEFSANDISSAVRCLQQGKNLGKLVINYKKHEQSLFQINSTYVISGGLGGIALTMLPWMVEHGAKSIVLLSRTVLNESNKDILKSIADESVSLNAYQCDVTDYHQLKSTLELINTHLPPIRGIFHAAGVLSDAIIDLQSEKSFNDVLAPKINGAWNFHTITMDWPLEYFVMFSSTASLLGNQGQSNHSAANQFMDSLAHYRKNIGLQALSINWSAWQKIGAAVESNVVESFQYKGVGALTVEQGLQSLSLLLQSTLAQVAVVPFDWPQFRKNNIAKNDLFYSELDSPQNVKAQPALQTETTSDLVAQIVIDTGDVIEQAALIRRYLRAMTKQVLRLNDNVADDEALSQYGLDSLTSIEIKTLVNNDINIDLPLEVFFKESTIDSWVTQISSKLTMKNIAASLDQNISEPENVEEFVL